MRKSRERIQVLENVTFSFIRFDGINPADFLQVPAVVVVVVIGHDGGDVVLAAHLCKYRPGKLVKLFM